MRVTQAGPAVTTVDAGTYVSITQSGVLGISRDVADIGVGRVLNDRDLDHRENPKIVSF